MSKAQRAIVAVIVMAASSVGTYAVVRGLVLRNVVTVPTGVPTPTPTAGIGEPWVYVPTP